MGTVPGPLCNPPHPPLADRAPLLREGLSQAQGGRRNLHFDPKVKGVFFPQPLHPLTLVIISLAEKRHLCFLNRVQTSILFYRSGGEGKSPKPGVSKQFLGSQHLFGYSVHVCLLSTYYVPRLFSSRRNRRESLLPRSSQS